MGVLKGTNNFYDDNIGNTLLYNIQQWVSYGLMEKGAYTTVQFSQATSGYTNLKRSYDNRYGGAGRVYEGLGPSWIWQSGVSVPSGYTDIFNASGVYVNNIFYPTSTTSGAYSHVMDYANGRVIFNTAVSSSDVVKCEYCFNDVAIYSTSNPQWRTIIDQYLSKFNSLNTLQPSGMASILKDNRVWLPCVVIEIENRTQKGLQLGGGTVCDFAVFYHIFSDNNFTTYSLVDILNDQEEKKLKLFNIKTAPFALEPSGNLSTNPLTYKNLIENNTYFLTSAYIQKSEGGVIPRVSDVYRGEIRQSILIDRYLSAS